jgi:NAD(P)-dependent dehydrogenase (short-subunit alcohol dehydrogenase family)
MADTARAVLITGATSGLGRYLARQLASSGWQVLAHGRDPARVADLTAELGGGARGYVADLASLGDVRELAALVRAEVPRLDVLVNNAGIGFGAPGEGRQVSADGHELRFAVNYLAPVLLTRLLVPLLTASAPSRIVNVGSLGQVPFDPADAEFEAEYNGVDAYRRSKLALAAFTFDLAGELAAARVTVNCLHPATLMNTEMVAHARITPVSTVEQGGEATMRLITDPGPRYGHRAILRRVQNLTCPAPGLRPAVPQAAPRGNGPDAKPGSVIDKLAALPGIRTR